MATKVIYKQGKKETYLSLLTKAPNALYFCTDTKELFKGSDLYTDGVRFVESAAKLPSLVTAAEGKLYVCSNSGSGYVLKEDRSGWVQVIFPPDNETLEVKTNGLIGIKAVPISMVSGLSDKLDEIESKIDAGGSAIASHEKAGAVKPGNEFSIADDGTLEVTSIESSKVDGIEELVSSIVDTKLVWESMDE